MTTDQEFRPRSTSQAGHEDEVLATIYSFDRFKIKRFVHGDVTILEVTGTYSPILGRKIERQAAQVQNSLGLDLSGLDGLQSSLLSSLQRVHKKLSAKKRNFLLCNPPEKLLDLLKLSDLEDKFRITDSHGRPLAESKSIVSQIDTSRADDLVAETKDLDALPVSKEITRLNRSLKRTEKLEKGLDSASECVRRLLPSECPILPDYDFAFSFRPCDKVGGDFFDFIPLDENTLGITIGDVSGHGIDSAIVMAMAKKVLRVRARDLARKKTSDVLTQANKDLVEELSASMFITVLYARLHLREGLIYFARAGHEPPVHFAPGARVPSKFCTSAGMALGMESSGRFGEVLEEKRFELQPGEGVLLYTDGIVESWNSRRDPFSRNRLAYTLEQLQPSCSANGVIDKINSAVDQFSSGSSREDDMTAIVIKRD